MSASKESEGSLITTGTFDGVHRGHQLVLEKLIEKSRARGLRPVVVTFDRHPLAEIDPRRAPHILTRPDERDRRLRNLGVEVVEIPFTEEMRRLTATQWMSLLRKRYQARALLLGYDNTFGCDGTDLDICDYITMASALGIDIIEAPILPGVSSSAIRKALAAGKIDEANEMLGYSWSITGAVVHGRGVGRNLGFRTANICVDPRLQLPLPGVYATAVTLPAGDELPAVTNIGTRPTFSDSGAVSIETHIPGYDGDLYGKLLTLRPLRRIRGEKHFDTIRELREQIAADIELCREPRNS